MATPPPIGWEGQVLAGIGAPNTPTNVQALDTWYQSEWGNTSGAGLGQSFNPLDTTQNAPGATSINSVGVKSYPSWDVGLAATVQTLENGYYTAIVHDLQGGAPYSQIAHDVNASPWGSSLPGAPSSGAGASGSGSGSSPGFGLHSIGDAANAVTGAVNPANLIVDAIKGLISNGYVMRGTLMLSGIIIVFIGLSQLTKGSNGAGSTLASGAQDLQVTVRQASKGRSSGAKPKPKVETAAGDVGEAAA